MKKVFFVIIIVVIVMAIGGVFIFKNTYEEANVNANTEQTLEMTEVQVILEEEILEEEILEEEVIVD